MGFADLTKLGLFQDEWLRGGPVRRWLPAAYAERPIYVFETGGSTGIPKSRINIDDFRIDYANFSKTLDDHFPHGADWLMLGPSGPRRLRLAIEHLAQLRGGICLLHRSRSPLGHQADQTRRNSALEDYKKHCIQQALTILRSQPKSSACSPRPSCWKPWARRSR